MSLWNHNHSELVSNLCSLGIFPERKALEQVHGGPLPLMPMDIAHDLARTFQWPYHAWLMEWTGEPKR